MGKYNDRNSGKDWTRADDVLLKSLITNKTPVRVVALKLARTENAVRSRVRHLVMTGLWKRMDS
jgi:hypothetical protein